MVSGNDWIIVLAIKLTILIYYGHASLYSADDTGIIVLDQSNFKSTLYNQRNAFFVEFYNSWCPHCIRFAPTWKDLGKDVKDWSSVVKLAAIDCAEEFNVGTCRSHNINSYPTLRYFRVNASKEVQGEQITGAIAAVEELRHSLIDFVTRSWSSGVPREWPDLMSFSAPNKIEFIRRLPLGKNLPILIVLEDQDSYVGREVILDFSRLQSSLVILRVLTANDELLKELLPKPKEFYKLPLLMQVKPDHSVEVLLTSARVPTADESRTQISAFIREQFLKENELAQLLPLPSQPTSKKTETGAVDLEADLPKEKPVYLSDLYKSLRYTLYQQIGLRAELNRTECNIVKRLVDATYHYFPFHDENTREFIKSVKQWLDGRHTLVMTDLLKQMQEAEKLHPLPLIQDWRGCRGSQSKYRGYTCSVWTLFHTLTVAEYLDTKDGKWSTLHSTLYTMKDYIPNFFSCSHCAKHFAQMAQNMESELFYANSSVLWLWKAHNKVNKRLAGDMTEDPEHPKRQYPRVVDCTQCYYVNGTFNEVEVLKFLVSRYGRSHIVDDVQQFGESVNNREDATISATSKPSKFTLSFTDMSLFLILYFVSALILVALFLSIKIKRKKKTWRMKENYFNNMA